MLQYFVKNFDTLCFIFRCVADDKAIGRMYTQVYC